MYSLHNRDDLEKLKKLERNKIFIKSRTIKRETWKARFHYNMDEVFELCDN